MRTRVEGTAAVMDDAQLEALGREVGAFLRSRSGFAPATASCLDEGVLAQLADGAAAPDVRAAAVAHLAGCATCRADLAEVVRAVGDERVTRAMPARVSARRWLFRAAVPVAAAAVLVLLFGPSSGDGGRSVHRERGVLAAPAPLPRSPAGPVARVGALVWSPVPDADRYRVTLFEGAGVLYDLELRDTLVVLPDSVPVRPGRTYLWKVQARTGFDRWTSSDLVRFSVTPEARR